MPSNEGPHGFTRNTTMNTCLMFDQMGVRSPQKGVSYSIFYIISYDIISDQRPSSTFFVCDSLFFCDYTHLRTTYFLSCFQWCSFTAIGATPPSQFLSSFFWQMSGRTNVTINTTTGKIPSNTGQRTKSLFYQKTFIAGPSEQYLHLRVGETLSMMSRQSYLWVIRDAYITRNVWVVVHTSIIKKPIDKRISNNSWPSNRLVSVGRQPVTDNLFRVNT